MLINTKSLMSLKTWAGQWQREVMEHGVPVLKTGCNVPYAHELFDANNQKPVALRVRQEFQLITIDGVKFVARISEIPKQPKTKRS